MMSITNDEAKAILFDYFDATVDLEEQPTPDFWVYKTHEVLRVHPKIPIPSAHHMAAYISRYVDDDTHAIVACGRFFKQIGETLFRGVLLYYVDRIGNFMVRGIDHETALYYKLDDSPYWGHFPFDFETGTVIPPKQPLGYHPGKEEE